MFLTNKAKPVMNIQQLSPSAVFHLNSCVYTERFWDNHVGVLWHINAHSTVLYDDINHFQGKRTPFILINIRMNII